jgi:hypothetical protein
MAGLACIQDALGGVRAFAGVSSLRIIANTKPTVTAGPHPVANKREIGVEFPDQFKMQGAPPCPASGAGLRRLKLRQARALGWAARRRSSAC